ncbi:TonB-dependent receptor [Leeuwenhoekiella sp. NPDC079379]|uniref:TonB-dependent receptor n=1 Tax=Leeuwenhoekiella sp. NPDC079379 TaxID=3364122 RepID=UPI0037C9CDB6
MIDFAYAQSGQLKGQIKDETGVLLPGASVLIEGTNKGTMTDFDGNFSIDGIENGTYNLVITYVGYTRKTVAVTVPQNSPISISLAADATQLDDVVVTGVFDARSKMESSVAISTLGAKELDRLVAVSAADLLKNTPGVYVNSSAGEVRNTVYARGISANSNTSITESNNGYYYVSLQEDGLPVTAISDGLLVSDLFFRSDASIKRLEAVRGGTSSITSVNAPGGIFNFLSKTGAEDMNEVRVRLGLEGDGKNPFYRADVTYGDKINETMFYNVSGFFRKADGARYAGYPLNEGGQLKASLTKQYGEGSSIRFFAKYLNDRNALAMVTPAQGFDDIKLAPGVNQRDSYLLPKGAVEVPDGRGGTRTFDPADANQSKDFSVGFNLDQKLNNNWSIANNFKYSAKTYSVASNTATSFTGLEDQSTYFFAGGVGPPGSVNLPGVYTFTDRETNQVVATVSQNLSQTAPPSWTVLSSDLPEAVNNSVFYNGTLLNDSKLNEVMNQFVVGKKWDNASVNVGVFYSKSKIEDRSMSAPTLSLSLIKDRPVPLDVSFAAVNGQTYQLSSPEGYMKIGGSFGYGDFDADVSQLAFFFGNNLSFIEDKLNIDWGFRIETSNIDGTVDRSVPNFGRSAGGGLDGNPNTVFDNFSQDLGANTTSFDKKVSGFSISAGANYRLDDNNAVYVRFTRGEKAPDLQFYRSYTSQFAVDSTDPENQVITQVEAAYKLKTDKINAVITPFYSTLSNITVTSLTADENNQFYYTPAVQNSIETVGVELELDWNIHENFSLTGGATVQRAKLKDWLLWDPREAPREDDLLVDYSGNDAENNPNFIATLTPTYYTDKFYTLLQYKYLGKRQANQPNAYEIAGFGQLDFGIGYNFTKRFKASVNINNLTNNFGIMTSLAPGDILQAFNPNRVTKESVAANPNAIHPVIAIQPRAYFLTLNYKL